MERQSGPTLVISSVDELRERAAELIRSYEHGTDDASALVAQEIARLPTPYAIAVTAAMCEQLDEFERLEFTNLLLEVAKGDYRRCLIGVRVSAVPKRAD